MKALYMILRIGMPIVYLCAGSALLLTTVALDIVVRYRAAIGGVLLTYGLLRIALIVKKSRQTRDADPAT
ncbi:MAG: hypothetical protein IPP83_18710 [Flavobacteriales bacterium]|nr:hypothetical protein [Flavobacteriales bacterium]MBL0129429.1 hypothetical protein [Flavobacteriales bacterium]MCC6939144.1 hypothetical protein [Flavobacteriales bacterium]